MPVHIKVAGVWKEADSVHIKVGGVWKTAKAIETRVSGVWKAALSAISVIVAATKAITDIELAGTAYAWVGVNADGDLYSSTTGTTPNVSYETWLDAGLNTEVWVQATLGGLSPPALTAGSDATGSRLACSTTRKWGYTATTGTDKTGELTLDFYDAASGGSLLDSQVVTLTADASV